MEMTATRLLLALLCLAGCQSETVARTEILLVVDSDLGVPEQLDRIEVHVQGPSGPPQDASAVLGAEGDALPRSVGLIHEGGPLGPLHATVQGMLAGQVVLTREARLTFLAGKTLVLPLHLVARCLDVVCEEQTCGELGCTSIDVDPLSLAPYAGVEPGLALDADAAAPDAAVEPDAAVPPDAGGRDGAVDSARDAGDGGASVDDGGRADAGVCQPMPELCNARDDDCDGRVDDGYDLSSDADHCGACGNRCTGATRRCCAGTCRSICY